MALIAGSLATADLGSWDLGRTRRSIATGRGRRDLPLEVPVPSVALVLRCPTDSLRFVMRLLAALGVLSPVAIAALIIAAPLSPPATVGEGTWKLALWALAAAAGVTTTSLIAWFYLRLWFGRLVSAAEKIAEGNLDVRVSERGG